MKNIKSFKAFERVATRPMPKEVSAGSIMGSYDNVYDFFRNELYPRLEKQLDIDYSEGNPFLMELVSKLPSEDTLVRKLENGLGNIHMNENNGEDIFSKIDMFIAKIIDGSPIAVEKKLLAHRVTIFALVASAFFVGHNLFKTYIPALFHKLGQITDEYSYEVFIVLILLGLLKYFYSRNFKKKQAQGGAAPTQEKKNSNRPITTPSQAPSSPEAQFTPHEDVTNKTPRDYSFWD